MQSEDNDIDIVPVDNTIYFNELDTLISSIANNKEYLIFWLISEGRTYEDVGKIFNLSGERIRQIFDGLLEKLP
nr:sigma factor-like helix-turn-helix DNA-binding protein [Staphylococcus gallinarum]